MAWLTASNPDDGLAILADRDVDCLVSDTLRSEGPSFVVQAADIDPALPVVLSATDSEAIGGATRRVATQYVDKGGDDAFATLLDHVRALASAPGDARADGLDGTVETELAPRPERRAASPGRSGAWVPIEQYDWNDTGTGLATSIVTAVEGYTGADTSATPPLYESIDAETLETLLSRPDGGPRRGIQVRFFFADQELAVTSEGLILLRTETE